MLIAKKLRKENICEYLLYMWQLEDLLRAFNFQLDALEKQFIDEYQSNSPHLKKEILEWYESIIHMMLIENVKEKGHIQLNKNIIIELNDFHALALKSKDTVAYQAKFFHVLPFINQLRTKSEVGLSDIELCFNFMYGVMLLRLRKQELHAETLQSLNEISQFMVLLAKNFRDFKNGDLILEEE